MTKSFGEQGSDAADAVGSRVDVQTEQSDELAALLAQISEEAVAPPIAAVVPATIEFGVALQDVLHDVQDGGVSGTLPDVAGYAAGAPAEMTPLSGPLLSVAPIKIFFGDDEGTG